MKSETIRLSVVIPTRERSNTLAATLKSVVTQDYNNLQIIVSDNYSNDNTKTVVESYSDPRIIYTNTGVRVGMSTNWEHGLSIVNGDYVMFLGDDDGLLPHACADISNFLSLTQAPALIWLKPNYSWPCSFSAPNQLSVILEDSLFQVPSNLFLRAIAHGFTSYGRLPTFYSGFVAVDVLKKIKARTDRFFNSVTPDVYSGIVIASQIKTYYYSMRPFSINGGSSHSNGQSVNGVDNLSDLFFKEADLPIHPKIPVLRGSIASCVAEAFLQAQDLGLINGAMLNRKRYLNMILKEILAINNKEIRMDSLKRFSSLEMPKNQKKKAQLYLYLISEKNIYPTNSKYKTTNGTRYFSSKSTNLVLQADKFGIHDVFSASQFVFNLFGDYRLPKKAIKITFTRLLASKIVQTINNKLSSILPIF